MKVLKFGGTSIGTPESFKRVIQLVNNDDKKIVVLSAFAGTTDALFRISEAILHNDLLAGKNELLSLKDKYISQINEIFIRQEYKNKACDLIDTYFKLMENFLNVSVDEKQIKELVSYGEMISTKLFHLALSEKGISSIWINALDFMRIDENEQPDMLYLKEQLETILKNCEDESIVITQGYNCRNHLGEIDNLKRGGSDYTATLIGAALNVAEIQIWSDMDGLQNNDPRWVNSTFTIHEISYRSATKLAYYGAKILHPLCLLPAKKRNIPVLLKNTFNPSANGTRICKKTKNREINAVAAKDKMAMIKIKARKNDGYFLFLEDVINLFGNYRIPIDLITFDHDELDLLVETELLNHELIQSLEKMWRIEIIRSQTIICITGFINLHNQEFNQLLNNLNGIPIQLNSFKKGAKNLLLVIDSEFRKDALNRLNELLVSQAMSSNLRSLAA